MRGRRKVIINGSLCARIRGEKRGIHASRKRFAFKSFHGGDKKEKEEKKMNDACDIFYRSLSYLIPTHEEKTLVR